MKRRKLSARRRVRTGTALFLCMGAFAGLLLWHLLTTRVPAVAQLFPALGTLVCCGTELVLLMLASALILRGAISEEMANGAVLVCAAVAAFLGCMIGARKTSKRAMMTAGCAASAWVTMQVIGFFVYDGLTPERSLELAAAMAVGAVAPLLLQRNGKKGRGAKARARRKRR